MEASDRAVDNLNSEQERRGASIVLALSAVVAGDED